MDIKRITEKYYEQLYTPKFVNLGEIDQLIDRYKLSLSPQRWNRSSG